MAKAKRKQGKRVPSAQIDAMRPTPEREGRNATVSAGMARRIKPMIDIYRDKGLFSASEYEMLECYRQQANAAENSPVRSCCDNTPRGGGDGPSLAIVSARLEVERMHRQIAQTYPGNAKAMQSILEAVARDDQSITQYCIAKYGGRERYGKGGKFIAIVPNNERRVVAEERANLLNAARCITR